MCPLHYPVSLLPYFSTSLLLFFSTSLLPYPLSLPTALLRLTRPHNALAAALCTLLGAHLARGDAGLTTWPLVVLPSVAVALVVGAVNCLNDVVDHVEDSHNAPHRPIPSGAVSRRVATMFALALLLIAGVLALLLDPSLALFGLGVTVLGVAYALRLKRTILVGNLIVGVVSGAPVLFGAQSIRSAGAPPTDSFGAVVAAFALVSLFVCAREVLKSVVDFEGDLKAGHSTTATRLGVSLAMHVFRGLAVCFALAAFVPWTLGIGGLSYFLPIAAGATAPLVWLALAPTRAPAVLRRWLRATKLSWFIGLAGLAMLR